MKKLLIIVILTMSFYEAESQTNMIKNHSFEDTLYLPFDVSSQTLDQVMNCLCDRDTNNFMTYPDVDRYNLCIGWYNTSYGHVGSTPDYFNEDVDPTHNGNIARYVDIPVNYSNALDVGAIPLLPQFSTFAHDGKAYVGLFNARYKGDSIKFAKNPWSEVISQKLNNPVTSNLSKGRT